MRFGAVFFYGILVLLAIAGAGSGVLVAIDWNSVASKETFEGLGVLLFLVGAGIGAMLVLATVFLLRVCSKQRKTIADADCAATDAAADAAAATARVLSKLEQKNDSAKLQDDAQIKGGIYDVEVRHAQISVNHQEPTVSDTGLLNKVGYGFKSVLHQISVRLPRWDSVSSDVFSPVRKSWEKSAQNVDMMTAPTPRIFVLPPDGQALHGKHSRSRSELPVDAKVNLPDVTILDIPDIPKEAGSEEDIESGMLSHCTSDLSASSAIPPPPSSASDKEEVAAATNNLAIAVPKIRPTDTNLGLFLKSLSHQSKNKMTYMLSVMIEEVLPRPDSGLLKRMLRMSEIPVGMVEGSGEPILHLRVGSECHLSIGLIKLDQDPAPFEINGPHRIRLKALDGEEVDLNASCEAVDEVEHVTSAIWDLKSHASHSLTRESNGNSSSTVLTPIEMSLSFHLYNTESHSNFMHEVEVKKTFMASMRRELVSLDVDKRFKYEDDVLDFVLSKMELISMPSLLMFLEIDADDANDDGSDAHQSRPPQ